ncbi:MAG: hypothetical protein K2Y20_02005 [Sphingomonas sp.]|nr:hypothetical protein [Sphingomonas sp.]
MFERHVGQFVGQRRLSGVSDDRLVSRGNVTGCKRLLRSCDHETDGERAPPLQVIVGAFDPAAPLQLFRRLIAELAEPVAVERREAEPNGIDIGRRFGEQGRRMIKFRCPQILVGQKAQSIKRSVQRFGLRAAFRPRRTRQRLGHTCKFRDPRSFGKRLLFEPSERGGAGLFGAERQMPFE